MLYQISFPFTYFGFIGLLVQRGNLFQMLVCKEITTISLIILFPFPAYDMNDVNGFIFTVFLITLLTAETSMGLCLLIVSSRKLSRSKLNRVVFQ